MIVLTFYGGVLLCYVGVDAVPNTAVEVAKVEFEVDESNVHEPLNIIRVTIEQG